jgi:hypothetical protein
MRYVLSDVASFSSLFSSISGPITIPTQRRAPGVTRNVCRVARFADPLCVTLTERASLSRALWSLCVEE